MTQSFFYTDPLAAAWMAKHFGMRFANYNNGTEITLENILRHSLTGNVCGIHIHSDSLHLLKHQVGDLVTAKNDFVQYVAFVEADGLNKCNAHCPNVILSEAGEYPFLVNSIMQRSGKAFHWPESEAA